MPRIVAVAVLPLNRAVLAVDDELGSLVATDFPASVYCFSSRVQVTASSFGPGTLHVPSAIWIRHYVVTATHTGDLMLELVLSGRSAQLAQASGLSARGQASSRAGRRSRSLAQFALCGHPADEAGAWGVLT